MTRAELEVLAGLEKALLGLLIGPHSHLILSFNNSNGANYMTVSEEEESGCTHGDWISDEERRLAVQRNSKWTLQWYPETPVGFHALAASSLPALLDYILRAHAKEASDAE